MIPWIIQSGLISFILIFLIHYLFTFFKENLTVPKVIDLVNKPKEQYEELLRNTNHNPPVSAGKPDMSSMKNELKNYLKDLKSPSMATPESAIPESAIPESATPESANLMGGSQYSSY
jgi:hypothetical protein